MWTICYGKEPEGKQNLTFQKKKSIHLHHSSGLLKSLVQTIHPQKQNVSRRKMMFAAHVKELLR
jgi:hypothetical protein